MTAAIHSVPKSRSSQDLACRLEDNLKASRQERQGAERAGDETDAQILPAEKPKGSSQRLFNLMPAPPVKD